MTRRRKRFVRPGLRCLLRESIRRRMFDVWLHFCAHPSRCEQASILQCSEAAHRSGELASPSLAPLSARSRSATLLAASVSAHPIDAFLRVFVGSFDRAIRKRKEEMLAVWRPLNPVEEGLWVMKQWHWFRFAAACRVIQGNEVDGIILERFLALRPRFGGKRERPAIWRTRELLDAVRSRTDLSCLWSVCSVRGRLAFPLQDG